MFSGVFGGGASNQNRTPLQNTPRTTTPQSNTAPRAIQFTDLAEFFSDYSHPASKPRPVEKSLYNVLASVVDCSEYRPTKGTDYVVNMRITDPSCKDLVLGNLLRMTGTDDLVRKVDVVFFSRNTDALPKLHAAGDIVRLQGAQFVTFNERPQLICKVPFRCHFSLFNSNTDFRATQILMPYQRSSPNFSIADADREKMAELCAFYKEDCDAFSTESKSICELEPDTYDDVSGKIIATENEGTSRQVMYLWDGTDATLLDKSDNRGGVKESRDEEETGNTVSENGISRRLPIISQQDLLAGCPEIGSILPISLFKPLTNEDRSPTTKNFRRSQTDMSLPPLPSCGSWARMRNLSIIAVQGQLQALYLRTSKWQALDGHQRFGSHEGDNKVTNPVCQNCESQLKRRREANDVAEDVLKCQEDMPLLAEIIEPSIKEAKLFTIREVLAYEGPWQEFEGKSIQNFRCLLRMVDYAPKETAQFCKKLPSGEFTFVVKCHLQDATGELDAMLLGNEGSAFFSGCPQVDLREKEDYTYALRRATEALCLPRERKIKPVSSGKDSQPVYRIVGTELSTCINNLMSRIPD